MGDVGDERPLDAFNDYVDALRVRLTREARAPTDDERRRLFALWDAVERRLEQYGELAYTAGGVANRWTSRLPTSRRALEAEFGSAVEAVTPVAPESETVEADTGGHDDGVKRRLEDVKDDERRRLIYAIRRHVDTGEPKLREIERDYRIPWRQVLGLRDREVERRRT